MSLTGFLKKSKGKTTIMYSHPDYYSKKRIVIDITDNNDYFVFSEGKIFSCNDEKHLLTLLKEQMLGLTKKEGETNVSVDL